MLGCGCLGGLSLSVSMLVRDRRSCGGGFGGDLGCPHVVRGLDELAKSDIVEVSCSVMKWWMMIFVPTVIAVIATVTTRSNVHTAHRRLQAH